MPEVCGQDRKKQVKSIQVFHTYVLYAKIGSGVEQIRGRGPNEERERGMSNDDSGVQPGKNGMHGSAQFILIEVHNSAWLGLIDVHGGVELSKQEDSTRWATRRRTKSGRRM
jgi:hypothetical protein